MHKAALPFFSVAIGAIGGPVVGDFIHMLSRQEVAENVLTFYDCEDGIYPISHRTNGTLQCAGVELETMEDNTASTSRVIVDWAATEQRVKDDYDSAKKARPSTFNWALGGAATAGVLQASLSSYVQSRAERRKVKAA